MCLNTFWKIRSKLIRDWKKYALFSKEKLGVRLGKECLISPTTCFGSEPYLVKMGDFVKVSTNVQFITHDGGVHVFRNLNNENIDLFGQIVVGNNVFIGTRAIIMPNVRIGDNCIIGAGSIVTKDVQDNSIVAGVPAKFISSIEEYYKKNCDNFDRTSYFNFNEKEKYLKSKFDLE